MDQQQVDAADEGVDKAMLRAFEGYAAFLKPGEAASFLSVPEEEARTRLERLVVSGHVGGPIWSKRVGERDEFGYRLLDKGRAALQE